MSHRPPAFTPERLLQALASLPEVNAYLVGFSGGADSTALLHALATLRDRLELPVTAVHINHGLHGDAAAWQSHCENFCRRYSVPLVSLDIEPTNQSGQGLEAEARHLRYAAIESKLPPGAGLLTAHHADDQAETLLLNLMRGSGVDGLAAMPDSRPFGRGLLQRPLLGFQGSTLKDYLREHDVEWVEDPSNQRVEHDRNFVRHELMPLLEQRWPAVAKRLLLTQSAMVGARHLLESVADGYLAQQLVHPQILNIKQSATADSELFNLVVRRWLKTADVPSIPVYSLESLYEQVCTAKAGHKLSVEWASCVVHCFRDRLWLLAGGEIPPLHNQEWPGASTKIDLGGDAGQLEFAGGDPGALTHGLTISSRSSNEGVTIAHGGHHKSLKNIFQSAGVPPWLRDCVPLCRLGDELVAVGDWLLSDRFKTLLKEHRTRLQWRPVNPLLQFVHGQQNHG